MSQCIISALLAEAEPIINYYNLEKNFDYDYPVYNRGDLTIICTGVGRENVRKDRILRGLSRSRRRPR